MGGDLLAVLVYKRLKLCSFRLRVWVDSEGSSGVWLADAGSSAVQEVYTLLSPNWKPRRTRLKAPEL